MLKLCKKILLLIHLFNENLKTELQFQCCSLKNRNANIFFNENVKAVKCDKIIIVHYQLN